MTPEENALAVLRLMRAFTAQDRARIVELIHPDCVWRVPGHNALAGEYRGRDEVLALFRTLKRLIAAPAEFDVVDVATSADRVMVYQYGNVVVGGRALRLKECLVYRVIDGQVTEVDEFQHDQAAFDAAFAPAAVADLPAQ